MAGEVRTHRGIELRETGQNAFVYELTLLAGGDHVGHQSDHRGQRGCARGRGNRGSPACVRLLETALGRDGRRDRGRAGCASAPPVLQWRGRARPSSTLTLSAGSLSLSRSAPTSCCSKKRTRPTDDLRAQLEATKELTDDDKPPSNEWSKDFSSRTKLDRTSERRDSRRRV